MSFTRRTYRVGALLCALGSCFAFAGLAPRVPSAGPTQAASPPFARPDTFAAPVAIVQGQLDAYNAHNLDAFVAYFGEAVQVYSPPHTLRLSGREALRSQYAALFAQAPEVRAQVVHRMTEGRFVVDHEAVTGLPGGRSLQAFALYEVVEGQIINLWMLPQ